VVGGGAGDALIRCQDFIAQQCARPLGTPVSFSSIDLFDQTYRGRWASCDAPGIFGEPWPGIEIFSDATWSFLGPSMEGGLVREYAPELQGTLGYSWVIQNRSTVELFLGSSSLTSSPNAWSDPSVVAFDTGGGGAMRYVALPPRTYEVPGAGPSPVPCAAGGSPLVGGGDDYIAAQCARPPGQPLSLTSAEQVGAVMRGRWGLCDAPGIFGQAWKAFEIFDDDTWADLSTSTGGAFVREHGYGVEGTVAYSTGPSGAVVIHLAMSSSTATFAAKPTIWGDPRILLLDVGVGAPLRYVALPPGKYELPDAGPASDPSDADAGQEAGGDPPDAGLDGDSAVTTELTPCRTDSDCPPIYEWRCLIPAVVSKCPSNPIGPIGPIGHCHFAPVGNCDTWGPLDPCRCLEQHWSPGTPGPCADFPNTACRSFDDPNRSSRCWACAPVATDASVAP
jgi:hypothetical protein